MKKPMGPLHPLPIPDQCGAQWQWISLVSYLKMMGLSALSLSLIDWTVIFGSYQHVSTSVLKTSQSSSSKSSIVRMVSCWRSFPIVISFFSQNFGRHSINRLGSNLRCPLYHPQLDDASEKSNKMINQCLCYQVELNQIWWQQALPWVCFNIMNSINT